MRCAPFLRHDESLPMRLMLSLIAQAPLMFAYRMIYDFTTLFLFTLCLALMARERDPEGVCVPGGARQWAVGRGRTR